VRGSKGRNGYRKSRLRSTCVPSLDRWRLCGFCAGTEMERCPHRHVALTVVFRKFLPVDRRGLR